MTWRPKLRSDIIVRRLTNLEESYVIVKDPEKRKYYQFDDWEYELLELLDGTRSLEEIARELGRRSPGRGDPQYVADYVEELRRLDVLEKTDQERHLVMVDRLKTLRKKSFYDAEGSSLFQIIIPMFDPDKALDRVMPLIRWWWSPWFVGLSLVSFAFVLGLLIQHWDMYWAGFLGLWNFPEKTFGAWVGFFILLFGVSVWHELGHGLTCKRYGGEVHDIGVMLFYFQPVFYCGIDDSYLFPRRSHRVWAALGGPYFELLLCSAAAAVWLLTPAEWWIHRVALTVVFFTGLSAIVFNMNPLIKFDAYYVLMDWLDVPNLREASFAYIGNLVKEHVFRLKVKRDPISRRRRRIYRNYGICSVLYTGLILWVLYVILRDWLVGWLGPLGYLLAIAAVAYIFRGLLYGFVRFVRYLVLDKRELLLSGRGPVLIGVGLALLTAALTLPRFDTRIEGAFVVTPGERAVIRAPRPGVIREVHVTEGTSVTAGQPLAVMESPELLAAHRLAESRQALARRQSASARRAGDPATARERIREERAAENRTRLLAARLDELLLEAPIPGVVSTPDLESSLGRHLDEGEVFCVVDRLDTVRLAVPLAELEIEEIRPGLSVRVLPEAFPLGALEARVLSVAPVAVSPEVDEEEMELDLIRRTQLIRVDVEVANPEARLRPGMTGRVQVLARPRSIAGKVWWRLRRWAASLVW